MVGARPFFLVPGPSFKNMEYFCRPHNVCVLMTLPNPIFLQSHAQESLGINWPVDQVEVSYGLRLD